MVVHHFRWLSMVFPSFFLLFSIRFFRVICFFSICYPSFSFLFHVLSCFPIFSNMFIGFYRPFCLFFHPFPCIFFICSFFLAVFLPFPQFSFVFHLVFHWCWFSLIFIDFPSFPNFLVVLHWFSSLRALGGSRCNAPLSCCCFCCCCCCSLVASCRWIRQRKYQKSRGKTTRAKNTKKMNTQQNNRTIAEKKKKTEKQENMEK